MRRFLTLVAVLAMAPFLLAACSDDDNGGSTGAATTTTTESNETTGATSTSTATTGDGATAGTGANGESTQTVTDDLDREVEVPAAAESVVALSPSVVELMYAVGATPVGRPESATYPPEAESVRSFGSSYTPNFEEIVAMEPDLIIADAIIHAGVIDEIEGLGAPVYAVKVDSFETVVDGLRTVGELTGNTEAGEEQAKALEDKMEEVKAKIPDGEGPSVLVVVAAGENQFIAARSNSYLGSLIEELGGRNIVQSEPENFRFPGFADYSLEKIVQADPDIVIGISVGGPPGTPKTTEILGFTPVWSGLTAVQEGRVFEVDPEIYLQSAGPRLSVILDELPGILYPDVFN